MYFVYVSGNGITEFDNIEEAKDYVKDILHDYQLEAVTIIDGKDITLEVTKEVSQ